MDKSKAQSYLDKINAAFAKLPAQPHEIDVDSLLGYVRIFYSSLKEMVPEQYLRVEPQKSIQTQVEQSQKVVESVTQPEVLNSKPDIKVPEQPSVEPVAVKVEEVAPIVEEIELVAEEVAPVDVYNNVVENLMEAESGSGVEVTASPDFVEEVVEEIAAIEPNDVKSIEPSISDVQTEKAIDDNPAYTQIVPEIESVSAPETKVVDAVHTEPEKPLYQPVEIVQPQVAEVINTTTSHSFDDESNAAIESLFRESSPTGLVDFLGLSPLDNLNKAWGLNERMLVIKDLFGNDLQSFEDTVQMINKLSTFDEAKKYLIDHVVRKYEWVDLSKLKKAKDFIKQVKRLFTN